MIPVSAGSKPAAAYRRIGILCLGVLLAAGCATAPREQAPETAALWADREAQLSHVNQWTLRGRIAVRTDKDGWSASLTWQQRADGYVIRVAAPLGRGTFELSGDGQGVTLRTADNRVLHADSPEALLHENLGWQLPVSGLYYWIRGLPRDTAPEAVQLDGQGRLSDLRQDGWHVSYERYRPAGKLDLPGKMTLTNEHLRVRLLISDWNFSS